MFKVGDIVECLVNYPSGAQIKKGEMAKIIKVKERGGINFENYPQTEEDAGVRWSGSAGNFILHSVCLENK